MHYAGADANIAINIHIFAINCGGGEVIGGGVGDKAIPNKYKPILMRLDFISSFIKL